MSEPSISKPDDWDSHWSDFAESSFRNPAQSYRFRIVRKLLLQSGLAAGDRLLDLGCGTGDFLVRARSWFPGVECAGFEMSATGVEIARRKLAGVAVDQANLLDPNLELPRGMSPVTHAVCSEVLEHVDDPAQLLVAVDRFLAKGAWLIVTVPGGPQTAYDKHIGHRRHFKPRELGDLLADAGYEVRSVAAAGFPFHNLYRLLVLCRGSRIVEDAKPNAPIRTSYRLIAALFDVLFRVNVPSSPWGWQTVALARKY